MRRYQSLQPDLIDAALTSARGVGTPLWLYEAEPIRQRVRQLSAFDCIRFAQKANSNTHLLRILRSLEVAVDAVSLGEIERALRAGYTPGTAAHEIVFTADIIDEATLARVQRRVPEVGVEAPAVDSVGFARDDIGAAGPFPRARRGEGVKRVDDRRC